jgi:response regulator RpfG family c-di-GMP phosphodiesterase
MLATLERYKGSIMADKILFVDDEPQVLDGLKRMLHKEFDVETAVGGDLALTTIRVQGPYSVVVSDMRMPGMNGAQFLGQVRQTAPDTVRMLLTGHTDWNAAMDAVNEGNIFRFLTKPCDKEVLSKAITEGLVLHHLITAEKELLENTLMGSIKVLADVLSAASPEAFGRSTRIAHCVRHMVGKLRLPSPWRFEAAGTLSQLGCVMLAPEVLQAAYLGEALSPENQARFSAHPQVARDLLVRIPRMEPIAWMIGQQLIKETPQTVPGMEGAAAEAIVTGAKMLKLAVAFDDLKMKGATDGGAIAKLKSRHAEFGLELVEALAGMKSESAKMELRKVPATKLTTGMILQQEIRTLTGMLMVASGQEITHALVIKLGNFAHAGTIEEEITVLVPV